MALSLTSIDPAAVTAGNTLVATVLGAGFDQDTRVSIRLGTAAVAALVKVVTAGEIQVTLEVPRSAPGGAWDLLTASGDGGQTHGLAAAVTVTAAPAASPPPVTSLLEDGRYVTAGGHGGVLRGAPVLLGDRLLGVAVADADAAGSVTLDTRGTWVLPKSTALAFAAAWAPAWWSPTDGKVVDAATGAATTGAFLAGVVTAAAAQAAATVPVRLSGVPAASVT